MKKSLHRKELPGRDRNPIAPHIAKRVRQREGKEPSLPGAITEKGGELIEKKLALAVG